MNGQKQIVVLDRGFVYVGHASVADSFVTVTDAWCVRRWGTSKGLGELAASGPLVDTKLDRAGTVVAPVSSLVHMIACDEAAWTKVLGAAGAAAG